ncbi:MAG: AmmeMemoRadiSam system protein A [Firmicutes bacterium]|jgi:AmmeMemoRadiSam system protein A|nr:AmmeMemoRadiSam system protein A [Bacillota bacterium]
MLLFGALVPHAAIIIREIGGAETDKVAKTAEAMQRLAGIFKDLSPETVVVFSPHGPVMERQLPVRGEESLEGNLRQFGSRLSWTFQNDRELVDLIIAEVEAEGLSATVVKGDTYPSFGLHRGLDHGVVVPLSFLAETPFRLVATGISYFYPPERQYALGVAIGRALRKTSKRVAVVASGDLSHCLIPGAPVAYNPRGKEFDLLLVKLLQENRVEEIVRLDPELVEEAAECGYRSILMLLGVFEGLEIETEVLSYEGPFGVGYAVATFLPGAENPARRLLPVLQEERAAKVAARRQQESAPVRLARRTVENYLRKKEEGAGEESGLPADLPPRAGVFVSIKKHGELRGCIGTIYPTRENLAGEIMANALAAAFQDPRFPPVSEDELEDLVYSVDILKPPEPVRGLGDLDPQKYGVIVRRGHRSGLLLPNLEGIETAEEQVAIARRKAGIGPDEPVELERFEVVRYY